MTFANRCGILEISGGDRVVVVSFMNEHCPFPFVFHMVPKSVHLVICNHIP